MRDTDRDYYAARALAERALADAPGDSCVTAIHLELALRYEAAARGETLDFDDHASDVAAEA